MTAASLSRVRDVSDRLRLNARIVRWPTIDLAVGRALLRAIAFDSHARLAAVPDSDLCAVVA